MGLFRHPGLILGVLLEDTEVFLNKPIQVRVIEADKAKKSWCFRQGDSS